VANTTVSSARGDALLEGPSDADLIAAVRAGDTDSYGVLFERHVESARRLARSLSRDGEADDLVSEAFAKVLIVLQRGDGPDTALRPYLLTALRRLHVDRVRSVTRTRPTEDMSIYDKGEAFTDTVVAGFESGAAARAFASLPERWQLVLWHLEVEGSKPADIAPLLGISPNSVSALAYRAREGLRQAFVSMHAQDTDVERCQNVRGQLGAFIRQDISKRDSAAVEGHLRDCRECAGIYLELIEVNSDLRALLAPIVLGGAAAAYVASAPSAAAATGLLTGLWHSVGQVFGTGSATGTSAGAGSTGVAASGGGAAATTAGATTAGATTAGATTAGAATAGAATAGAATAGAATAGATALAGAGTAAAAGSATTTAGGLMTAVLATPLGTAAAGVVVTAVAATTVVAGVQAVTNPEPTSPPAAAASAEPGAPSDPAAPSDSTNPEDPAASEAPGVDDPDASESSAADSGAAETEPTEAGSGEPTDEPDVTDPEAKPSGSPEPSDSPEPSPSPEPEPTGSDVAMTSSASGTSGVFWVVKLTADGLDADQAGTVVVTVDRPALGFHLDPRCDLISRDKLTCRLTGPGTIKLLVAPQPGEVSTLTAVLTASGDPDPNPEDNTTRVRLG
jgi:RNA polymerase sigma factor (sigma-70 family)